MWRQWERISALHCTMQVTVQTVWDADQGEPVCRNNASTLYSQCGEASYRYAWFMVHCTRVIDSRLDYPPHTQYVCTACAHALSSVVPSVRNVVIVDKSMYSEWYLSIQCTGQLCWAFYKCRVC